LRNDLDHCFEHKHGREEEVADFQRVAQLLKQQSVKYDDHKAEPVLD